jgi:hypothetical protein
VVCRGALIVKRGVEEVRGGGCYLNVPWNFTVLSLFVRRGVEQVRWGMFFLCARPIWLWSLFGN